MHWFPTLAPLIGTALQLLQPLAKTTMLGQFLPKRAKLLPVAHLLVKMEELYLDLHVNVHVTLGFPEFRVPLPPVCYLALVVWLLSTH